MSAMYLFLDEGGNLDFSSTGTKYFSLTSLRLTRPFLLNTTLDTYKYDLMEYLGPDRKRIDAEYFHCADDNMHVRSRVFNMIAEVLPDNSVDAVLVEKRKTGGALQVVEKFFPKMLGYLLRYNLDRAPPDLTEIIIITDTLPVSRKRQAVEKGLKTVLAEMLPKTTPYRIMHHASKSHYGLQVADYVNWAIWRKWERQEMIAYDQLKRKIRSEFDIFRSGTTYYY
jgi:hypothetical protein